VQILTSKFSPKQPTIISVNWGCSPENVEKLINTVLEEMKKMVENGPTDTDIEKAKETFIKEGKLMLRKTNSGSAT
jgi:zinc protease